MLKKTEQGEVQRLWFPITCLVYCHSRVLDQSAAVVKAQPRCGPLHPHSLPVALGHHQQHLPAGQSHAFGDNRSVHSQTPDEDTTSASTNHLCLICVFIWEQ